MNKRYNNAVNTAKEHWTKLSEKYGSENVSSLKYSEKSGKVSEKVVRGRDAAAPIIGSMASVALMSAAGAPVAFIYVPKTAHQRGRELSAHTFYDHYSKAKYEEKVRKAKG